MSTQSTYKLFYLSSIIFTIFTFFSCEKTKNPDLTYDFANLQTEEIEVNEPLVLQSAILNKEADCNCTTQTAGNSFRGLRLEYRADENSPWIDAQLVGSGGTPTYELIDPVPEIVANDIYPKVEGFIFSEPGIYRYKLASDRNEDINERDEDNNNTTSDNGEVKAYPSVNTNAKYRLIVKVIDSTGKTRPNFSTNADIFVKYIDMD